MSLEAPFCFITQIGRLGKPKQPGLALPFLGRSPEYQASCPLPPPRLGPLGLQLPAPQLSPAVGHLLTFLLTQSSPVFPRQRLSFFSALYLEPDGHLANNSAFSLQTRVSLSSSSSPPTLCLISPFLPLFPFPRFLATDSQPVLPKSKAYPNPGEAWVQIPPPPLLGYGP